MPKGMLISLIAAMGKNRVIGRGGALPWDLPDDRIFFRKATLGKVMIKGRKTYESIGRLLPDRAHVIMTKDKKYAVKGARIAHSKEEALELAKEEADQLHTDEIMVIGGAKVYEEFLPEADRIYLTIVDAQPEGDAFFPEFDEAKWREISREHHPRDERHAYSFDFVTYERAKR